MAFGPNPEAPALTTSIKSITEDRILHGRQLLHDREMKSQHLLAPDGAYTILRKTRV